MTADACLCHSHDGHHALVCWGAYFAALDAQEVAA